jgi:spore germination protein
MNKKFFVIIIIFCVGLISPLSGFAAQKISVKKFSRIFYFRDSSLARESLFNYPSYIDVLAPQAYAVDENAVISGSLDEKIIEFAKKKKIKIMPLLTNGKFTQKSYTAVLDNSQLEDSIIAGLIVIAQKNGFWGWQIDFEQMNVSYREKFSSFIKKMHDEFKIYNLILSVAVIAQVSENPDDYNKDLWQKLIGVYDYKTLAENSDFISVMSYDDPESKGPVAEMSWLKRVLEHSLKNISAEKISLGIPLYYWKWNNGGKRVETGGRKGISNAQKKYKISYYYSTKYEAPYMRYKVKGKQYTLWYENAKSIKKKVDIIKKYKLNGFSAWALGLELASIYPSVRSNVLK